MRRLFFCGAAASIAFAACVGDEPTTSSDGGLTSDSGTDGNTVQNDGSAVNDSGSGDGGPNTGPCDPNAPFGTPVAIDALNSLGYVSELRLTSDGLTGYFAAIPPDGSTNGSLWTTTRSTVDAAFGAPVEFYALPSSLSAPSITADNLSLYFSDFQIGLGTSIDLSSRTNTGTRFFSGSTQTGVGGSVDQLHTDAGSYLVANLEPFIQQDGSAIFFISDRLANGQFDMFSASSDGDGGFGTAFPVTELNGPAGTTRSPTVTADGLVIYFSTTSKTDGGTETSQTIYVATRASTGAPFSNVRRLEDDISLDQDSYPTYISSDRCTLYFSRISTGGVSTSNLYSATKTP